VLDYSDSLTIGKALLVPMPGRNTKLLTGEEEGSEGWVDGGFDAFALHG
jgi:hypothetical protein